MNDAYRRISQEINEARYNREHINGYIREEILANPVMQDRIAHGVQLIQELIEPAFTEGYYASKNKRLLELAHLDIDTLVVDIFVGVAYCMTPELFTSVTSQMASRLRFNDRAEAITTVAEMMAVLCNTDAFDILKPHKMASLMIESRMIFSDKLIDFISNSQHLPPMVCPPMELENNYSSGYLTHNDSLILGSGNHHDGDICLDVLNKMNNVELSLDLEFLCTVEEEPTFELDTREKKEDWMRFKKQSYRFYDLIQSQGNKFYLTHQVDKRGRIYASGYHINSQGSSFKKAMINFANEEYIEGVP